MVLELPFDPEVLVHGNGDLFPSEISNDPWMAYHGTSILNSQAIERSGFRDDVIDSKLLAGAHEVVEVYSMLGWSGEDPGGFAVLQPWSLGFDVRDGTRRYISFAESALRAALYATRDFAGGEMRRAIRKSIDDLRRYSADDDVRQRHIDYVSNEREHLIRLNAASIPEIPTVNLDWLEARLSALAELSDECSRFFQEHAGGVVYAVRFTPDDVSSLTFNNFMGLLSHRPVSPERIVARILMPRDAEWPVQAEDDRRLEALMAEQGIWAMTDPQTRRDEPGL